MRIKQKNVFSGGMDQDSDLTAVAENDYIKGVNIENGVGDGTGTFQIVTNLKGNTLRPATLPAGANVVVGSEEDKFENSLFYFVQNSNENDTILRYLADTNVIEKVIEFDFGWTTTTKITGIDFVNKELLYWVDPLPRKINVNKATANKKRKYNLVLLDFTENVTIRILDENGVSLLISSGIFADYDALALHINTAAPSQYLTATVCGEHVEAEFIAINEYTLTFTTVSGEAIGLPDNFYPIITARVVYRGRYPHPTPPVLTITNNTTKGYNLIEEKNFEFRLRIIYDDKEKATYSPISDLSLFDCVSAGFNGIRVTFTEASFTDVNVLAIIKRVEIIAREGNDGKFKRIKTIEREELWDESGLIATQYYDFFNDGNYETIADIESLRNYDALGREINGQQFADDRLFDAGILENYNAPCPDANITAEFTSLSKLRLFNISGEVKIYCDQFYGVNSNTNDPSGAFPRDGYIYNLGDDDEGNPTTDVWGGTPHNQVREDNAADQGQQTPTGGFVVYLPGTNFYALTEQDRGHGLAVTPSGALSAATPDEKAEIVSYIDTATARGGGIFKSTYTLRNVPAGSYVVRVASPWCGFPEDFRNDFIDKGSFYDLNNNSYNKTSMPIKGFTDTAGVFLGDNIYEIRIEIDEDGVFRIYSQNSSSPHRTFTADSDNNIYAGEILVYDNISPQDFSTFRWCVDGYLFDSGGGSDGNSLAINGVTMGRQRVLMRETQVRTPLLGATSTTQKPLVERITDHNGYFYYRLDGAEVSGLVTETQRAQFLVESINSLVAKEIDTSFKLSPSTQPPFHSGGSVLDNLYSETLVDNISIDGRIVNGGPAGAGTAYFQVLLYNRNTTVTKINRTQLVGQVVDTLGRGIKGISVVYERNGRQESTKEDGTFSILVYGDWKAAQNNSRTIDSIIFNNPLDCEITFSYLGNPNDFYREEPQIIVFGSTPGDYGDITRDPNLINFLVTTLVATITNIGDRYLKGGGSYIFRLLYTDEMSRRADLVDVQDIYIPFITEDRSITFPNLSSGASDGVFNLTLNISGTAPSWATYVHVLRTLNSTYNDYLQVPAFDLKYVADFDGTNIIETTFETATANELYINIADSLIKYQNRNANSNKVYTFTPGDRIRFISDQNGTLIKDIDGNFGILDLKIKAERTLEGDDAGIYLVVEISDALPEIKAGVLVEVYSPKLQVEDDDFAFFEIHTAIAITNGVYAQTAIPISTGDTYRRTRQIPILSGISSNFIEDNSISDFYISKEQDIGRVSFENPDFKEIFRSTAIRFSGKFFEDTEVNNLSSFETANVEQLPKNFGAIRKLVLTNDDNYRQVLLSISENKTASLYLGEVIFSDLAGEDVVALSSKVLGAIRTLKGDYGTTNPESVAAKDGMAWWWDGIRGKEIRYALNGLTAITDLYKMRSFAKNKKATLGAGYSAVGVYDSYKEKYILTFIDGSTRETIAFDESKKRFTNNYDFEPEWYGVVDDKLFSFVSAGLWEHDTNAVHNNFYGTQYQSEITLVFNIEAFVVKLMYQLRMMANSPWYCPNTGDIELPPNDDYPTGMISRLKKDNFRLVEGQFWGDFLRDMNDPRFTDILESLLKGRPLRGEVIKIRFENASTSAATLRMIEVAMEPSMETAQ